MGRGGANLLSYPQGRLTATMEAEQPLGQHDATRRCEIRRAFLTDYVKIMP